MTQSTLGPNLACLKHSDWASHTSSKTIQNWYHRYLLDFFVKFRESPQKNGRLSRPALCCDFSVQNVPWLAEAVASHQINRGCSQLAAACIWGAACEIPMVLFTQLYTASNYIPLEKYKHLQDSQTWYCLIDAGETKLLGGDHFWRLGNVGFDYGQLAGHTTFIHLPLLPQDPWSRQN